MSRVFEVDFTGAPPAQGGMRSDRVPQGRYRCSLEEFQIGTSNGGKTMYTAVLRTKGQPDPALNGRRLIDRFAMPLPGENMFPVQRLHAFFLAIGLPVEEKKHKFDADRLPGRECDVDVIDEEQAPTPEFPNPRVNSKPNAYYPVDGPAGMNGAAPAKAAAPPPPAVNVDMDVLDNVASANIPAAPAPAQAAAPAVDVAALSAEMDEVLG